MKPEIEFPPMQKIARLSREVVITEKIDGTNASVYITEDGKVYAGSRTRWISPEDDNYGFAKWVKFNETELLKLGPGHHFGEWWGNGIQRNYGLKEKRFSLFNVARWESTIDKPSCVSVVPVLARGIFNTSTIYDALGHLDLRGSVAAPGFMKPEGIVIYHTASGQLFKKTIDGDALPKGLQNEIR